MDAKSQTSEEGALYKNVNGGKTWGQRSSSRLSLRNTINGLQRFFKKKKTADYSAITTWGVFFIQTKIVKPKFNFC
jgi:photosystem II stability/assembly factor-like uncharacterized protein